jgi:hypothetical protein
MWLAIDCLFDDYRQVVASQADHVAGLIVVGMVDMLMKML